MPSYKKLKEPMPIENFCQQKSSDSCISPKGMFLSLEYYSV